MPGLSIVHGACPCRSVRSVRAGASGGRRSRRGIRRAYRGIRRPCRNHSTPPGWPPVPGALSKSPSSWPMVAEAEAAGPSSVSMSLLASLSPISAASLASGFSLASGAFVGSRTIRWLQAHRKRRGRARRRGSWWRPPHRLPWPYGRRSDPRPRSDGLTTRKPLRRSGEAGTPRWRTTAGIGWCSGSSNLLAVAVRVSHRPVLTLSRAVLKRFQAVGGSRA